MTVSGRVPLPLIAGLVGFVGLMAWLLTASLSRPEPPVFTPSPVIPGRAPAESLVTGTLTVDARDAEAWRFVSLARGTVLSPPDTAGWDLAIRRFHIVSAGGLRSLGDTAFEIIGQVPADGYVATALGADTVNPAIARWYRYGFFSHQLSPKGHVWALRTPAGRYAKLEVIGYYCPGLVAGCVTLRYAWQPDGSRRVR